MAESIKDSSIYKLISRKDFIYMAIYSLESYVFEKDLLDEKDYKRMLELRDPFNHEIIDDTIDKVRKMIKEVLIDNQFFEAEVYFRPKKINNNTDKIESRPLHSASLITLITSVVLLNVLLIEISEDGKSIELTELARMLPSNFFGNIPSERPEHLFKPWQYQFKEYTDVITRSYYEYSKTKEFKYEVTLDLQNFFPSINPVIIYDEIISKYAVKYNEEQDFECLKVIVSKLLIFKIINLKSEKYEKIYYNQDDINFLNGEVWSRGILQGLPHAYFFGNICMVKVAEIFQQVIGGKDGKAYFYVDDSVIYTNNLKSIDELDAKIRQVNDKLKELSNSCQKPKNDYTNLRLFNKFNYLIKVHGVDSEKSTAVEIQNPKYGQANLNSYSKLASMTSFDMNKIFSDTEEINLSRKLESIYQAVEKEIERIRKNSTDKETLHYIKVLLRFKKFFKYRQKCLEYNRINVEDAEIQELKSNFEIKEGNSNEERLGHFFKAYDEDILLNEFRYFFANVPGFWREIENTIEKFNACIYGSDYKWFKEDAEKTVSYFHKICRSLANRKNLLLDNTITKYDSIQKIIKRNVWNISRSSKNIKESKINNAINQFFIIFSEAKYSRAKDIFRIVDETGLFSNTENRYFLIRLQTDEFYRIIMNAYFSEIISVEANDLKYLAKRNNKPIYYDEARILLFLRNSKFDLKNFYMKFQDYKNSEVLDYTLFEIIDYFVKFVQDPVYVDNLIMVHKYTSEIWKNGSKYLHFYTLHNQEHAIELIRLIIMFTKSVNYFQISRRDYYILFISCYLHDISMVLHPNLMESFIRDNRESNIIYSDFKKKIKEILKQNDEKNTHNSMIDYVDEQSVKKLLVDFFMRLDQYYEGFVRSNHPKQSAKFIRKSNDFEFVEDVVKDIVAEISQAHGYDVDEIYKIKSNAKESIVSEKYVKILLRIGDLLDMSSSRISNAILDNSQNSMGATTRFHWLSHKAISNVDISVKYDLNIEMSEENLNYSWVGPGSITEKVEFVIHLDVKHLIGARKSDECQIFYDNENSSKAYLLVDIGKRGSCAECNYMCKWMKIKNDYLYKELESLQLYLNRSEANLFKTNIKVKYEFNENARRLSNSEYENIANYIKNK
ncbi:MAG: hypothetical protein LLG02_01540 [Pelosinus sp.]|nr:hypothetical protein [Pelosinus sp.]